MFRAVFRYSVSVLVLLAISTVSAQEALIEEIIVTAQKREQSLQDVPLAVAVLTGDYLEKNGATSIEQLRDMAAGIEIVNFEPGSNTIAARGIANLGGGEFATAPVGIYLDEAPISAFGSSVPDVALFDIERIEILRGPQGTLYGEGSMAGTIRVVSKVPDADGFSSSFSANLASVDNSDDTGWNIRGMLNVPVGENAALRIAAIVQDNAGWVDVPGLGLEDTNGHQQTDVRAALRVEPSDKLAIDASILFQDLELDGFSQQTVPGTWAPEVQIPGIDSSARLSPSSSDHLLTNVTVNYDFGRATLVSSSSLFNRDATSNEDLTPQTKLFFSPGTTGTIDNPGARDIEIFSQEVRLVSNGDEKFDWTVGVYYKDSDRRTTGGFVFDFQSFIPELGPLGFPFGAAFVDEALGEQGALSEEFAVFAEADFELSEKLRATLGLRSYSVDWKGEFEESTGSIVFGTTPGAQPTIEGDDSKVTPNLILTYEHSDSAMFFLRVAEGFRAGGLNFSAAIASAVPATYDAESLRSFEFGTKLTFTHVQLNAYVYQNDWDDLQLFDVTSDGLFGFRVNAGKAKATGAELELLVKPNDSFTIGTAIAYTDSQIDEDVFDALGGVIASNGDEIPLIPELSGNLWADYRFPVGQNYEGSVNAGYAFRSSNFSTPDNSAETENDSYGQLNLRVGVENERYGVYLFGHNLTNEEDTTQIQNIVGGSPLLSYRYVRPRTIGVEFRINSN